MMVGRERFKGGEDKTRVLVQRGGGGKRGGRGEEEGRRREEEGSRGTHWQ